MSLLYVLLAQEAPPSTNTLTKLLETDKFIPGIAIVGGLTVATLWMFMHYFYSWIELCKNNEIKLRMIEAGHDAAEIERVIWAGKTVEEDDDDEMTKRVPRKVMKAPPAKSIPQHVA